MATIRDVAELACVSVGTVSRVMSKNTTVKSALKKRVLTAVKELNYKPNLSARALRTNRVDVIGLIVPDITNPFFSQLALCIETEAAKRGHSVMLANSHGDAAIERRQLSALLDHALRGIVVVAASDTAGPRFETDVSIVSLDRRFDRFPLVSTDHRDGSAKVANYLFELGHRQIAYIAGPQDTEVARARKHGFVARIEQLNRQDAALKVEIFEGRFNYDSGEQLGRRILAGSAPWIPTAIAAASDQLAIGVLRAMRDLDMNAPADCSVVGFDDIELASLVVPRLTTIRQPTERLARAALEHLFSSEEKIREISIKGELVVRGSTGKPSRRPG